jgi:hypothetical protein
LVCYTKKRLATLDIHNNLVVTITKRWNISRRGRFFNNTSLPLGVNFGEGVNTTV